MKKTSFLTLLLAGALTTSSAFANELAAAMDPNSMPAMRSGEFPTESVSFPPEVATKLMSAFNDALRANKAAGSFVINVPSGAPALAYSSASEGFFTAPGRPALMSYNRLKSALKKAQTASYFGSDTGKVLDRDVAMHNAILDGKSLTNLPGGVPLKTSNGSMVGFLGVNAVGPNGQDVSAKVAEMMSQQIAGMSFPSGVPSSSAGAFNKK